MRHFSRYFFGLLLAIGAAGCGDPGTGGPSGDDIDGIGMWDGVDAPTPPTYPSEPLIYQITPASGPTTGGSVVNIRGAGFRNGASVILGDNESLKVKYVDPSNLVATTPAGLVGPADVTVENPDGGKVIFANGFTYYEPGANDKPGPQILEVIPNQGPAGGGTALMIKGSDFQNGASVYLGWKLVPTAMVASSDWITLITPSTSPGTHDIAVTNPDGRSDSLEKAFSAYEVGGEGPTISEVYPVAGSVEGGLEVAITGDNISADSYLILGGAPVESWVVDTPSHGTFVTPPHEAGMLSVAITNPDGMSAIKKDGFLYFIEPPVLHSVDPSYGPEAGGNQVTLSGSHFDADMRVTFGGNECTALSVADETSASCTVPASAEAGAVDVRVETPDGLVGELPQAYTYGSFPLVVSVEPTAGPVDGGIVVMVLGKGFAQGTEVYFGSEAAQVVHYAGPDGVGVLLPPGEVGTVDVRVNVSGAESTLPAAFTYELPVLPTEDAPTLAQVQPATGPTTGGGWVMLKGFNLPSDPEVTFDGVAATDVQALSSSLITARVPMGQPGAVDVAVVSASSSLGAVLAQGYVYYLPEEAAAPPPDAAWIKPALGPVTGGTLAIMSGTDFQPGASVFFDGAPADNVQVFGPLTLTLATPAADSPGAVDVAVVNADGQFDELPGAFVYAGAGQCPVLTGLLPAQGSVAGGTSVALTGMDFSPGSMVFLDGKPITATLINSSTFTFVTEAHAAGLVDVQVTSPDGCTATLPGAFNFVQQQPFIASVTPNVGLPAGGTDVIIEGQGFNAGCTVTIGGAEATVISVTQDETAINAVTPPGAEGYADVTVVNPDFLSDTLEDGFQYTEAISGDQVVVTSIVPNYAPIGGGTSATINGGGFAADASIIIGVELADPASVQVLGPNALTFVAPPGPIGAKDVEVVVPNNGSAVVVNGFFHYDPDGPWPFPNLVGIQPNTGPTSGGTIARIDVSPAPEDAQVYVDGIEAAVLGADGFAHLVVEMPAHDAGAVSITVMMPDGKVDTLYDAFTYYQPAPDVVPPTLTMITPSTGSTLGGDDVEFTGTGFAEGTIAFLGYRPVTELVLTGDSDIDGLSPAHPAGLADAVVSRPDGFSAVLESAFGFVAPPPNPTAIFPSVGHIAGGTVVAVQGTGFEPDATVFLGGASCEPVSVPLSTVLTCVTPPQQAPGVVDLLVINPDGQDGILPGAFTYTDEAYTNPPPEVLALVPDHGPFDGGTVLAIYGSGFQANAQVLFGGVQAFVHVIDETLVTVTTPPGYVGPVDVSVLNPDGQSGFLASGFDYIVTTDPPPAVVGITPPSGPEIGGTPVILTGANFTGGGVGFVGYRPLSSWTVLNSAIATGSTSIGTKGENDVVVTNGDGQSAILANGFTYIGSPVIDSFNPALGAVAGGTLVTIAGHNFVDGATVEFGGVPSLSVTVLSELVIKAMTPVNPPGPAQVRVTNLDGQYAIAAEPFLYVLPPTPEQVFPTQGTAAGGTPVIIWGTDFLEGAVITFGDAEATGCQVVDEGQAITCLAPAGTSGETVNVKVENPDGQAGIIYSAYTYVDPADIGPPPAPSDLEPPTGPVTGGTWGLINGADIQDGAWAIFGAAPVELLEVLGPTRARFVSGASPVEGPVDVTLLNPDGGHGTLVDGFIYTDPATLDDPPEVTSLAPDNGRTSGGTMVNFLGSDLDADTVVFFDTSPAIGVVDHGGGSIDVTTPAHEAGLVDVVVTDAEGQTVVVPEAFTYIPPPEIMSIIPTQGPSGGGTFVEITGMNFIAGPTPSLSSSVIFCEEYLSDVDCVAVPDVQVTVVDEYLIAVTTPAHFPGLTDVVVVNPDGQVDVLEQAYYFTPPPEILNLTPPSGTTEGGEVVEIYGTGFQAGASVTFSGNPVASVEVQDVQHILVTTPPGAPGPAEVTVTNPDLSTHTLAGGFLYIQPPKVLSVFPNLGPETGGTQVTIQGDGFVADSVVTLGGTLVPAGDTTFISKTMIQIFTPPGTGPAAVRIDNPDGQFDILPGGFLYIPEVPAPEISYMQPDYGPTGGGYLVTIYGNNFQTGAQVYFGSDALGWWDASNEVVKNVGTLLTAVVPAHVEGFVDVKVENSDGQFDILAGGFEYHAPLGLPGLAYVGIDPERGPLGGGYEVIIWGQGFMTGIEVYFGYEAISDWYQSPNVLRLGPTVLRVTVPPAPAPGPVDVRLSNPPIAGPDEVIAPDAFVYGQSVIFEAKGHRLPVDARLGDRHVAIFDANGDGHEDVLVLHNDSTYDDLWINTQDANGEWGQFVDVSAVSLPVTGGCCTWHNRWHPTPYDVDKDSDIDVVFYYYDRYIGLYRNQGDGTFTLEGKGNFDITSTQDIEVGDLNCDGIEDLYISRYNAPDKILLGDGNGNFALAQNLDGSFPVIPVYAENEHTRDAAIEDIDHDGDFDVVLAQDNAFPNRLYYNNCNNTDLPPLCVHDIPGCTMFNIGSHRYAYCPQNTSRGAAQTKCRRYGYGLATINDQAEHDFIVSQMSNHVWIGYNDIATEDTWEWTWDASSFEAWCGGQPNNSANNGYDCAIMNNTSSPQGCWDDQSCGNGYHYLCEADTNYVCPAHWQLTNGSYGDGANFPISGFNTRKVEIGDLNADGWEDVLILNYGQDTMVYFNSAGNFLKDDGLHTPQNEPVPNDRWGKLVDVDNDNDLDLVVAKESAIGSGNYWPSLYLNDGAGIFTDATITNIPARRNEYAVYFGVGDLNSDTLQDIYVVKPDYQDWLFLNNGYAENVPEIDANRVGIGSFANNTFYGMPEDAWNSADCAVGDVDGDTDIDIIMNNSVGQGTTLWINDGAGNFFDESGSRMPDSSCHSGRIELADINNDGDLDLLMNCYYASPNGGSGGVRQYVNDGLGYFTNVTSTNHPDNAGSWYGVGIGSGDIDGDGLVDWVIGGNSNLWRTFINGGDPWATDGAYVFTKNNLLSYPTCCPSWQDFILEDLDGDLDIDCYAANTGNNQLWHNDGTGQMTNVTSTHLPSISDTTRRLVVEDVDFDGDIDFFVVNNGTNRLHISETDHTYADATASNLPAGLGGDSRSGVTADFDRDGYPDFFVVNYSQQNHLLLNQGAAKFGDFSDSVPPDSDRSRCTCTADFDNNGAMDVFICGEDADRIYLNKTPAP